MFNNKDHVLQESVRSNPRTDDINLMVWKHTSYQIYVVFDSQFMKHDSYVIAKL